MFSSTAVFSVPNDSNHFKLLVSAELAGRLGEVFILGDSGMSPDAARTADNSITVLDTSRPSPAGTSLCYGAACLQVECRAIEPMTG